MRYNLQRFVDRYLGIPLIAFFYLIKKIIRIASHPPQLTGVIYTDGKTPLSILIIKLAMLGDTVLLEPSVRAVRQKYPAAKISVLCSPVNEAVVRNWDFIDEIIVFDFKQIVARPWKILSFVKKYFLPRRFDVTVDYEQWLRITPILAFLSRARLMAGFKTKGQARDFLFDKKVAHDRRVHEIKCFAGLTSSVFGFEVRDLTPRLKIDESHYQKAQKILVDESGFSPDDKYAVIHPGCGSNGTLREWPSDRYAFVADYIASRYFYKIIITGGPEDKIKSRSVASKMKSTQVDLSGRTDFLTLAALISRARILVCGNTGVVHIASATGTPSVVVHGPTDYLKWGPLAPCSSSVKSTLECYPCLYLGYEYKCRLMKCLESITPQMVTDAVDKTIACLK